MNKNNEPVVIAFYDGDESGRMLSNFAYSPFILDEKHYSTVEGFWQSLKFGHDPVMQEKIALMTDGIDAKQQGRFAPSAQVFEYCNNLYAVGSQAHHVLLERALRAKFGQNELYRTILLDTGVRPLKHRFKNRHGVWRSGDSPRLPAIVFERILEQIRYELKEGTFREEMALPVGIDTNYKGGLDKWMEADAQN